jgi:squalene-associated FAD-dependent desaturase
VLVIVIYIINFMKRKVYIIGAGLAGLSAAYSLNKSGHSDIEIFEASPYVGGRCRSFHDDQLGADIDNGNHLIVRANENIMTLISELGVAERFNRFEDSNFRFFDNKEKAFYNFNGKDLDKKTFGKGAKWKLWRFTKFQQKGTVHEIFRNYKKLYERLIKPISRSILNTSCDVADAEMLRSVMNRLSQTENGFEYFYPKKNWGNALIEPLISSLDDAGVKIYFNKTVKKFHIDEDSFLIRRIIFADNEIDCADALVILATTGSAASRLVEITMPDIYEPIINIHFKVNHTLPAQICGVINSVVEWVFVKPRVISTTFSAARKLVGSDEAKLAKETWQVCSAVLGLAPELPEYRVIIEKRATFASTKDEILKRPEQKTRYKNLYLAGDYVNTGLPATIEGAILSGKNAAALCE